MKHNFSSKRQAIYEMLMSRKDHPSAKEIYDDLKGDYPDLSLGTVYRNLALFKEEGTVNAVCSINGEERLDGNTKPHTHLVCTKCGSITDFFEEELTVLPTIETKGFLVERKFVTYYGLCAKCR